MTTAERPVLHYATSPSGVEANLLRRGLLWLAGLTNLGIAAELAIERHWTQPSQLVAWLAVAATLVAVWLVARPGTPGRLRLARVLSVVVVLSAVTGIAAHVYANFDAGPLDFRYGDQWDSLSLLEQCWLAVSKTVGPSPPLAPAALAEAAACVLLATVRRRAGSPG
jgi:hypothetical protein